MLQSNIGHFTLDHVIIFVGDLAVAERAFAERLGLQITSHADHPGFGTRNAAIAFELGFLELLTKANEAEMQATRYARLFLERYERHGDGPSVFVFRTPFFEEVIAECKARGGLCEDRMVGYSRMIGGPTRRWECAFMPGTEPVFLDPRLPNVGGPREGPAKTPGHHPVGARQLDGVVIAVNDLDAAVNLYRVQLGLHPDRIDDHREARAAWFTLSEATQTLVLAQPRERGNDLAQHLSQFGEGIFAIILKIDELSHARREFDHRKLGVKEMDWLGGLPVTDHAVAANTRLVLRE